MIRSALIFLLFSFSFQAESSICSQSFRKKAVPGIIDAAKGLAEQANLSVEEVAYLLSNFHQDVVTDGATSIFKIDGDYIFNSSVNLVNAYKWGLKNIDLDNITFESLVELRRKSIELIVHNENIESTPLRWRHSEKTVSVPYIQTENIDRMLAYGMEVTKKESGFTISYHNSMPPQEALKIFSQKLNLVIKAGVPFSMVMSWAMQELLLIHPFENGNGRTARLLGQILFKKYTGGNLMIPQKFHKELEYSVLSLEQELSGVNALPPARFYHGMLLNMFMTNPTFSTQSEVVPARDQDALFYPEFTFGSRRPKIKYADLAPHVKKNDGFVYFGRPASSRDRALSFIKNIFTQGRNSFGPGHLDVRQHMLSTQGAVSGFFSTSKDIKKAAMFAFGQGARLVFIIDARDAEVFDIDEHEKSEFEGEVLFPQKINPRRIYGVLLDVNGRAVPEFIYNPGYKPHGK